MKIANRAINRYSRAPYNLILFPMPAFLSASVSVQNRMSFRFFEICGSRATDPEYPESRAALAETALHLAAFLSFIIW